MQSDGGTMIFVFFIPSTSFSTSSMLMSDGFVDVRREAFWHISLAVPGPTLENSVIKNDCNVFDSVDFSILCRTPSSTPYGCGFISTGFLGISSEARANTSCSAFGLVYTMEACGLVMAVSLRYSSTLWLPC